MGRYISGILQQRAMMKFEDWTSSELWIMNYDCGQLGPRIIEPVKGYFGCQIQDTMYLVWIHNLEGSENCVVWVSHYHLSIKLSDVSI